jgi:hypothetical protein
MIEDFHQVTPQEYGPPNQRTQVFLLYDATTLYIGVRLFDTEADRINQLVLRQGEGLGTDDRFFVMIDTFNNRRSGYLFGMNPNGVRFDGLFQNVTERQFDWDGIWAGASSVDEQGWMIEYAIPFNTLSFDPQSDTWRMNFQRTVSRNNENSAWASRNRRTDVSIMAQVTGFEGLQQGVGLDVVPSVSVGERKHFDTDDTESINKPSLDVFYKITPSLNGALTLNTDFSATEIDDRQVNLSRFEVFFPEKRDFFLQDLDIFEFGRVGGSDVGQTELTNTATTRASRENGRPFFSRRMGLSATREEVDLNYGAKVSGRIGQRLDVGFLAVQQDEFETLPESDVFVGRLVANVLSESSLGVIATSGDPRSELDNSLAGFDFRYLNSRLPGGRSIQAEAWHQQSDTQGIDADEAARGLGVRMPNTTGWRGGIGWRELEDNFKPALGFVNRTGIRDQTAEVGYTHRPRGSRVRTVFGGLDAQRIDYLDTGDVQTEVLVLRALELDSHTRDQLNLRFYSFREGVREPFEISEGVIIPPGLYEFEDYYIEFQTGNHRTFSGGLIYRDGDFFDGERLGMTGTFRWRPSRHFRFDLEYEFNDIELPQGNFDTRNVKLQIDTVISNKLSWVNLFQYDNISEGFGLNSRLHWIPEAGREGYIVFNHNSDDLDRDNDFTSRTADLSVKFNYTFRF